MPDDLDDRFLDKRTRDRYLRNGELDEKTFERYVKSLPDLAEKTAAIETQMADAEEEPENPSESPP
jgi:hypothetical protein